MLASSIIMQSTLLSFCSTDAGLAALQPGSMADWPLTGNITFSGLIVPFNCSTVWTRLLSLESSEARKLPSFQLFHTFVRQARGIAGNLS